MHATRIITATIIMSTITARADGAVIVNGSFESPIVPINQFTNFVGHHRLDGGVRGGDSTVGGTFTQTGIVFQAQSGSQCIDLAGISSNSSTGGVTQNVATAIGATYQLAFYVGSATDNRLFYASTVDLSINGGSRVSFTNPVTPTNHLDWRLFTSLFTATSVNANVTFFNGSAPVNYLSGLDNVSIAEVSTVPEPSSIVLLGVGAVLVSAGARWRRSRGCRGTEQSAAAGRAGTAG